MATRAPAVTYPYRVDLYEPDELTSDRTHGLPFRRITFRGRASWANGEDWVKINERLGLVGYRVSKPLERASLQPRGEFQWRAGAAQMRDRNLPGRKPGRIGSMVRPLAMGPGPDEPVKSRGGVTVIDWPRGRPADREDPLPDAVVELIIASHQAGVSMTKIAESLRISRSRVRKVLE